MIPDADVQFALDKVPGGELLDSHSAYWPELDMVLTTAAGDVMERRAVGSCPSGSICAFGSTGATGSRLSWRTCGTKSTSALQRVRSIANGRASGVLKARNGSTVVATASHGTYANLSKKVTNVTC